MSKANRRRTFLINPKFQLSFIGYSLAISVVVSGVFYGAVSYFFHKFRELGEAAQFPPEHVFFQFIGQQQSSMNLIFLVASFAIAGILFFLGLKMSHRVAGPLYRLHRHMLNVARGKTSSNVKFRKGDFFPELQDAYNEQLKRFVDKPHAKAEASEIEKKAA